MIRIMFEKIIQKIKFGSCKTKTPDDVDAFKESGKKKPEGVERNEMAYRCKHCRFQVGMQLGR